MYACLTSTPILCLATLCLFGLGCGGSGPERQPLNGAVLFDGRPLKAGTIRFLPQAPTRGPAALGKIQDGFYEIAKEEGVVAGQYRVEIEGDIDVPFALDDQEAYEKALAEGKGNPIPPQPIPARYNRQSTLTADISTDPAAHKIDFDLTGKRLEQTKSRQ